MCTARSPTLYGTRISLHGSHNSVSALPFSFASSLADVSACRVPQSSAKPWLMLKPLSVSLFRCPFCEVPLFSLRDGETLSQTVLFLFQSVFFFSPIETPLVCSEKEKEPSSGSLTFLVCFQPSLLRSRTKTKQTLFRFLPLSSG